MTDQQFHDKYYDQWYQNYRSMVFRKALFLIRNWHDAEDITQEVFLKIWLDGKHYANREPDHVKNTILVIARNKCYDLIKRKERLKETELAEWSPDQSGLFSASPGSDKGIFTDALNQMKPQHKWLIIQHHILGLTVKEIVKKLGISEGHVKKQLYYARQAMKELINEALEEENNHEKRR